MTTTEPHPALAHRCPFCGVEPGQACRTHRGRGSELDYPHSRRIALARPDMQAVKVAASVRRKALCCVCGNLRTVSPDYHRSNDPNYGYGDQARAEGWRHTQTLKCDACQDRTRHALLRPTHVGDPDYDEKCQRYILGGEWHDQYAPDREQLRAEYFAQFARNPYLTHRRYTAEAQKAWDDGTKWVTALCGAQIEVKVDPRQAAKYSEPEHRINGYLVAEQLSDIEYEDPETGLWWLDMDCVDCIRVSNELRRTRRRKLLESWLAWFARHPETIGDTDAETLMAVLEPLAKALNEQQT